MDNSWSEKGFYYEEKKIENGTCTKPPKRIKPKLLLDDAKIWAREFVNSRPELKSAQIRRFYHDVKALEYRIVSQDNKEKEEEKFEENLPLIKMLKSKVAYACPKYGKKNVPEKFKEFMDKCIDGINSLDDFKAFILFFEAVVGYFYGEGGRKE